MKIMASDQYFPCKDNILIFYSLYGLQGTVTCTAWLESGSINREDKRVRARIRIFRLIFEDLFEFAVIRNDPSRDTGGKYSLVVCFQEAGNYGEIKKNISIKQAAWPYSAVRAGMRAARIEGLHSRAG
jgi:hypothetical protein